MGRGGKIYPKGATDKTSMSYHLVISSAVMNYSRGQSTYIVRTRRRGGEVQRKVYVYV